DQAERLRIQARDVLGLASVGATAGALTELAEAVLEAALAQVAPPLPMALVAMGRFGGAELSYASDLDVLFVYEGSTPEDFALAEQAAEALVLAVRGPTPATRIYNLDADLRPEGRQGPLARSLAGFAAYYQRWAQTWERQALVRARPVGGDATLGRRFMEVIEPFVWGPLSAEETREIRRMKARVERERIPPGDDPQFHLKLGRGSLSDVEWTVQLLQLRHGVRAPGTISAIGLLAGAGVLAPADAEVLGDAYRFCERARNRWFLVKGAPGDALPAQPAQLARLAHSLDTTAGQLRDDYRRVTRRARQVVERVFYGKEPEAGL
ncbi:MAG: bifunctional [glutamine synthetase] adenylyltransferase/[glutamine synthetase]-adenylyl-L-tyrosine phosphorylase, partial [Acidimicrobiales bacterium]